MRMRMAYGEEKHLSSGAIGLSVKNDEPRMFILIFPVVF